MSSTHGAFVFAGAGLELLCTHTHAHTHSILSFFHHALVMHQVARAQKNFVFTFRLNRMDDALAQLKLFSLSQGLELLAADEFLVLLSLCPDHSLGRYGGYGISQAGLGRDLSTINDDPRTMMDDCPSTEPRNLEGRLVQSRRLWSPTDDDGPRMTMILG